MQFFLSAVLLAEASLAATVPIVPRNFGMSYDIAFTNLFNAFDADRSSKLGETELMSQVVLGGGSSNPTELKSEMKKVTDKDELNYFEFLALVIRRVPQIRHQDEFIKSAFNALDVDKSNSVDSGEILKALTGAGVTVDALDISDMIKTVDADGNGSISDDEFKNYITGHNE